MDYNKFTDKETECGILQKIDDIEKELFGLCNSISDLITTLSVIFKEGNLTVLGVFSKKDETKSEIFHQLENIENSIIKYSNIISDINKKIDL